MNATKSRLIFHLIAIVTVIIWGTTFVSTKILIQNGLTPSEIFFYRFVFGLYLYVEHLPQEVFCQ